MERTQRIRMGLLGMLAISLFAALFARLWYLQVISKEESVALVEAVQYRTVDIPAARGRILDVQGRVLVDNRPALLLSIDKELLLAALPTPAARDQMYFRLAAELSRRGELTKVSDIRQEVNSERLGPYDVVPVIRDVDEDLAIFFAERSYDYPGVVTQSIMVREYPYGSLAAHVLGYVGAINEEELEGLKDDPKDYGPNDEIGKEGAERSFESFLRGTPGSRRIQVDRQGRVVQVVEEVPAVAGNDIQLTIDIDLQSLAEAELRQGLIDARSQACPATNPTCPGFPAPYGSVVLLHPDTGAVAAMASYPTYDPREFVNGISPATYAALTDPSAYQPLLNRALSAFAPASTIKPFVSYAALDSGLIGPNGVLGGPYHTYDDQGIYKITGCIYDENTEPEEFKEFCTYQNPEAAPMGGITLPYALARSSDVYFYFLGDMFEWRNGFQTEDLTDRLALFGFGEPTGISLSGEQQGLLLTPALKAALFDEAPGVMSLSPEWEPFQTIFTAIGQDTVSASPLQMALAYGAIANGGTLYTPSIAAAVLDPVSHEAVLTYEPRARREIPFPAEYRDPIIEGLTYAVEYYQDFAVRGTAYPAFERYGLVGSGFRVAGKTGTAEHADAEGNKRPDNAWFIGFGPLPDAEYVGAVYLYEAGFGGSVSAPVLARIFKAIADGTVPAAVPVLDERGVPLATPTATPTPNPDGTEATATPETGVVQDGGR